MKKIISIISIIIICLMLFACTTEPPKQQTNNKANNNSQNTTTQCTHEWNPATCIVAKTCKKCNKTDGKALGHNYTSKITKATCTTDGVEKFTCSRCNDNYDKTISKTGHKNTLQTNGEDICSNCNEKSFTTYSVKALSGLYKGLKNPNTATISSISAGAVKWEEADCIAVATSLSAQNGFGGISSTEYVTIIDVKTGTVLSYDMVGAMEEKEDYYYEAYLNYKYPSQSQLDCLNKSIEYRNKAIEASNLKTKLTTQDLNYINDLAKKESGLFSS